MERLTIPDTPIEGGLRRTVIDAREVRKHAMTIYWQLKKYEDVGLTPDQIREMDKLYLAKCEEVNRLRAELAAERQKHRWIPWDGKNLPPEGELVEVVAKPKILKTPRRDIGYYDRDREEWWKYDDDGLMDVIAWKMPSEPYQPEKGGE